MLPRRVHDRWFERGRLHVRPVCSGDQRHKVHRPDFFAEVGAADSVNRGFVKRIRHFCNHLVTLGRRDRGIPLNNAVTLIRPVLRQ